MTGCTNRGDGPGRWGWPYYVGANVKIRDIPAIHPRALLLAVLVLAAACGSTVPSPGGATAAGGSAAPGAAPGGLSIPGTTTGGTTVGGGSAAGGTSTGGSSTVSGGTTTGDTTTTGGTTPANSTGQAPKPAAAPGITATTISVGAIYTKNVAAANAAIGGSKRSNDDARDEYNAVIDDINRHGGIAGRKVVPVFAPLDATSSTPMDQQRQAACATWTQDHTVFAILAGGDQILEECARKAGAVELYSTVAGGGTVPETFRRYPHYVEIAGMNVVRMASVTVDGLAAQGYFGNGAKVGVVTWDDPGFREGVQKGYVPALARHGLKLATQPAYLSPPQTVQDLGATSAQVNGAVLRFQSAGVDHVILQDGSAGLCGVGCIGLEFMNQAKSQHYYPRYGLNDSAAPVAAVKGGSYPTDQLKGSLAVTWTDIDKTYDVGWHVNQTRERCYELMRKSGIDMSNLDAQSAAMEVCDELWFLRDLVARLGGATLTPDNLISVVDSLGSDFASSSVYATDFGPTRHEGVALVRNLRFVDSCTCYRYSSRPYAPR